MQIPLRCAFPFLPFFSFIVFTRENKQIHCLPFVKSMTSERIYALSDLHVDQKENMQWIEQISSSDYLNDTIIVAGRLI